MAWDDQADTKTQSKSRRLFYLIHALLPPSKGRRLFGPWSAPIFLTNTTATPATNTTSSISSNGGGGSPLPSTVLPSFAINSCPVRSFLREQKNQNKQKMSNPPTPVAAGNEAYIEADPVVVSPAHSYAHACTNAHGHQLADAGSDYESSG